MIDIIDHDYIKKIRFYKNIVGYLFFSLDFEEQKNQSTDG